MIEINSDSNLNCIADEFRKIQIDKETRDQLFWVTLPVFCVETIFGI